MTLMLDPKEGESIYDPTCGTGGMLLVAALQVKEQGKEYRSLKLYGQDINLITSSIARMNLFLHGIDDFEIVRGDTLAQPAFLKNDKLPAVRRGAGQSAVLDQEVEPGCVCCRSVWPEYVWCATAGPGGLRVLPAHHQEHEQERPGGVRSSSRTGYCSGTRNMKSGRK